MLQIIRVRAELLAFLREHREGDGPIDVDTDLFGTGLLDSLLLLDLILHVQHAHGVTLGAGDVTLANFRDLAALSGLIVDKTREKAA